LYLIFFLRNRRHPLFLGNTMLQPILLAICGQVVIAGFPCNSGFTTRTGSPNCAGAVSSTCTASQCCTKLKTCADYSVSWIAAQLIGNGCRKNGAKSFFDLYKSTNSLSSTDESSVRSTCCTPSTQAKCGNWPAVCPSGYTRAEKKQCRGKRW